jgi:hypothetical protein
VVRRRELAPLPLGRRAAKISRARGRAGDDGMALAAQPSATDPRLGFTRVGDDVRKQQRVAILRVYFVTLCVVARTVYYGIIVSHKAREGHALSKLAGGGSALRCDRRAEGLTSSRECRMRRINAF